MNKVLTALVVLVALMISNTCFADAEAANPKQGISQFAPKASFFLVGGHADNTVADFAKLAGGDKAKIAIIPHASDNPEEAGDLIQNDFASLGVEKTTLIMPGSKVGIPKDCNAIWFCGGDQARLKRLLDEPLLGQIQTFDGLIGGTSAGSMIWGPFAIARGMDVNRIVAGLLRVITGLDLIPGVAVDTHTGERSRDTRMAAMLAMVDSVEFGIGLDEDTAIYIHDGRAKVYGMGHVRIFERGEGFSSNIKIKPQHAVANVKRVMTSFLSEGDEFDLPKPAAAQATTTPAADKAAEHEKSDAADDKAAPKKPAEPSP